MQQSSSEEHEDEEYSSDEHEDESTTTTNTANTKTKNTKTTNNTTTTNTSNTTTSNSDVSMGIDASDEDVVSDDIPVGIGELPWATKHRRIFTAKAVFISSMRQHREPWWKKVKMAFGSIEEDCFDCWSFLLSLTFPFLSNIFCTCLLCIYCEFANKFWSFIAHLLCSTFCANLRINLIIYCVYIQISPETGSNEEG